MFCLRRVEALNCFKAQQRTQTPGDAAARVIDHHFAIQDLLADGLDSKWFQLKMTGSANAFRRAGCCDEDLQTLGCAAKLLKRTASQLLGEI